MILAIQELKLWNIWRVFRVYHSSSYLYWNDFSPRSLVNFPYRETFLHSLIISSRHLFCLHIHIFEYILRMIHNFAQFPLYSFLCCARRFRKICGLLRINFNYVADWSIWCCNSICYLSCSRDAVTNIRSESWFKSSQRFQWFVSLNLVLVLESCRQGKCWLSTLIFSWSLHMLNA